VAIIAVLYMVLDGIACRPLPQVKLAGQKQSQDLISTHDTDSLLLLISLQFIWGQFIGGGTGTPHDFTEF